MTGWILSRYIVTSVVTCVLALQSGFHGFPPPTFTSEWMPLSSVDDTTSYREIVHGLGQVPVLVKVLVKVTDGTNQDFVFEATGSAQTDNDLGNKLRGGVLYAYTKDSVHVWSATDANTFTVFVASPWGGGKHSQTVQEALVQVQVWSPDDFYPPDYVSAEITMGPRQYREIHHSFAEIPTLLRVVGSFSDEGSGTSVTYFFDGTGNLQATFRGIYEHAGGVVYAYSATTTRLWTLNTDAFMAEDGWGHNSLYLHIPQAKVKVQAWFSFPCLEPILDSDWLFVDHRIQSFYEMSYPQCTSARYVHVELRAVDGLNTGYIFEGTGTFQSAGRSTHDDFGGVVFAYSHTDIRLWFAGPSSTTTGVISIYGASNAQMSPTGEVRVRVWCGSLPGTPVCPASQIMPRCSRVKASFSQPPLNSSLILLSSNAAPSSLVCARRCLGIRYCSTFSSNGHTCELYAEKQFGNATEITSSGDFYQLLN